MAVVGCGALGSTLAEMMVRSGVGALTVIDRDYVEESNLQRQSLFDEEDAERGLPKAAAAERRLKQVNSEVAVRGVVADLAADNAAELLQGADLVLDGTDNFETRFHANDEAVRRGLPLVHGAALGCGWGHSGCASRPNIGLQATAYSLRSYVAPASGGA